MRKPDITTLRSLGGGTGGSPLRKWPWPYGVWFRNNYPKDPIIPNWPQWLYIGWLFGELRVWVRGQLRKPIIPAYPGEILAPAFAAVQGDMI